jgi:uncharacterized protein (DUF362 family)/Pyruvate/2-oxoacid:ferredoxin oxidoreductase delta subunit
MNRSKVAIIQCQSYDPGEVYSAVKRGVGLLGGVEFFARPGEKILLKPNILAGDPADRAVATHPAVLQACVRLLVEAGARVSFGDSPGVENAVHAAKKSGLYEAGEHAGGTYRDFTQGSLVENPAGRIEKRIPLATAVQECDGMINLPKMKTHQLTRITGAVKNLFGCIPGQRKALYHVQHQDIRDFCSFLVDLNLLLKPRLHILDGIVAMEGNGPRSGDAKAMNVLVLSADPVAVDATFCRLVDLDPTFVPTITIGAERGLGCCREEEIEYVGDALEMLRDPGFKVIRKPVLQNASYAYYNSLKNLILPRPVIADAGCVRCGLCVQACPVPGKALKFSGNGNGRHERPPKYDYDLCIRCYCCHEMCPNRAIEKKTPLLGKLLKAG